MAVTSGTVFSADREGVDGVVTPVSTSPALATPAPAPTSAPPPTSAPVLAAGVASQPLARNGNGEATYNAIIAGAAPASRGDEVVTPAETTVASIRFESHDRIARGTPSQRAFALDDPTASIMQSPVPRYADLAADFLPFDRAAVSGAIDRFLEEFDNIAAELVQLEPSSTLLTVASAVAVAALTFEAIKRRRRSQHGREVGRTEDREEEMTLLRSLPSSWNWGLADP
jgi:hypothetical protein